VSVFEVWRMDRWKVMASIAALAALAAAGCSRRAEVLAQDARVGQGEERRLDLPWKAKDIADTIQDLSDNDWQVRRDAMRDVVGAGPWIVPFLMVGLKNPNRTGRAEICYCLGRIGDRTAVPSLLELVDQDQPYDVLVFALDALGSIGDPSAAPAVRNLLEKYELPRDLYVRQVGETELKMIESREATVKDAAAEALCRLGDNSGLEVLIENLKGNGWVRRDAAVRLNRLTGCKVDFGFYLDMPAPELEQVHAKWVAWYEAGKESFRPEKGDPREALDIYMPRTKKD